jgi:hypothetical protein
MQLAVSVAPLAVSAKSSVYELPRHVVPNIAPEEFARWLARRLDASRPPRAPLLQARALRPLRERVAAPGRV